MGNQSSRSPKALLDEFIEYVLQKRQIGRIDSLCFHRVNLFTGCSWQYYSVSAVQEQLLRLFSDFPDIRFEVQQQLTDIHTKNGAAAVVRVTTTDSEGTGFVVTRTAGRRITTLRLLLNLYDCTKNNPQDRVEYPAAEVVVAAVPNKVYLPYGYLQEIPIYHLMEDYMYQLAGLPRAKHGVEVESSQNNQVCLHPGSIFLADVIGERTAQDQYAYLLIWYKGLMLPQGNITTSGASYLELNAQGLQRDIRVFDGSILHVLNETRRPLEVVSKSQVEE